MHSSASPEYNKILSQKALRLLEDLNWQERRPSLDDNSNAELISLGLAKKSVVGLLLTIEGLTYARNATWQIPKDIVSRPR